MKTEELINAFGQIDDKIFAETEKELAGCFEEQGEAVMISAAAKKTIRPYLAGAAVLALAVALPFFVKHFINNAPADIEPFYTSEGSFMESADGTAGAEPVEYVGKTIEIIGEYDKSLNVDFDYSEKLQQTLNAAYDNGCEVLRKRDGELLDLYAKAYTLAEIISGNTADFPFALNTVAAFIDGFAYTNAYIKVPVTGNAGEEEDWESYYYTGISYDSFYNELTSVFTESLVEEALNLYPYFYEYDGVLWVSYVSNEDKSITHIEYELVSQSNTEAVLRRYVRYIGTADGDYIPEYDPELKGGYIVKDFDCVFILTENGFRAEKFFELFCSDKDGIVFLEGESVPYDMLADFNSEFDYSESGDPKMIALLSGLPAELTDLCRRCSILSPMVIYGAVPFAEAAPHEYTGTLWETYADYYNAYYQTGYSYSSFCQAVFSAFTEETAQKILKIFKAYNGGLWGRDSGWGGGYAFFTEYEISSLTDTEIIITRTDYYGSSGYEVFDPDKKDEYAKNDYECKFVLTDKGWRAEKFFELEIRLNYNVNMSNEDSGVTPETAEEKPDVPNEDISVTTGADIENEDIPSETSGVVPEADSENPAVYIDGEEYTLTGEPMASDMLADYELEKYYDLDECGYKSMTDFLEGLDCPDKEELKNLYRRAHVISFYEGSCGTDNIPWESVITDYESRAYLESDEKGTFFETGFTYDSFYNNYLDVFTKETAERIFELYPWFLSYNGELWIIGVSGGSFYTQLPYEEYEVVKQTDAEITVRRTLYFYDWVSAGEEQKFDHEKKELYTKQYSDCKFVLTDNGWRIGEFFGFSVSGTDVLRYE